MDSSPLVQIVTTVIGVLSFAATVVFWVLGRSRKGLGYEVLTIEPLIEKKGEDADKLEIRFDDRVVEEPHVARVRICNAERTTIRKADFQRPITVSFGSADVYPFVAPKCFPSGLSPNPKWDTPHVVSIQGLDLNPGAEIEITALVARKLDANDIECHTIITDAVNGGDARLLNVGPPMFIQWIGIAIKWTFQSAMVVAGLAVAWLIARDIFKQGLADGLLKVVVFTGVVMGPFLVIVVLARLLDRSKWPDFLR